MSGKERKGTRRKQEAKGEQRSKRARTSKKKYVQISSSICDCCTTPMQKVLSQVVGQQVMLVTVADQPKTAPVFLKAEIQTVDNFLISVQQNMVTYVVSIFDVLAVFFNADPEITLLQPLTSRKGGECLCKEKPLREQFNTMIRLPVNIHFHNGLVLKNGEVLRTGEGTVLLQSSDGQRNCVASLEKMSYFSEPKDNVGTFELT